MKTIRNSTPGLAVVFSSVPMFAGQPVDTNHGQTSGKRVYEPVSTVAPPANGNGQTNTGQPDMAIKGAGVPQNTTAVKPAQPGGQRRFEEHLGRGG